MTRVEYQRQWRKDNKTLIRRKAKLKYQNDIEFRDRVKNNATKRYLENPELKKQYQRQYYKDNRKKVLAQNKKWRENNPEKYKTIHANAINRRRARIKGALTEKYNRDKIFEKFGGLCIVCDKLIERKIKHPDLLSFTIHHIIPISKGGNDVENNVAPAHFICNIKVGNRMPIAVKPKVMVF